MSTIVHTIGFRIHFLTASYHNKRDSYGLIMICDSWMGHSKWSIINFLIYCDIKTFFQTKEKRYVPGLPPEEI